MTPALLSAKEKDTIQKVSAQFPKIGQAYQLKNEFYGLWGQTSIQDAEMFLDSWCQKVNKTKNFSLKHVVETLQEHKQHIVHFSVMQTDPAAMEKIHENILLAISRTKGLQNMESFRNMIFFCDQLCFPAL